MSKRRYASLSSHLSWLRLLVKKTVPDIEIVKAVQDMLDDIDRGYKEENLTDGDYGSCYLHLTEKCVKGSCLKCDLYADYIGYVKKCDGDCDRCGSSACIERSVDNCTMSPTA